MTQNRWQKTGKSHRHL